ncbi:formimidoylglutamase [Streptococcus sp. DD13]|uniref:formimidoylglutamase n=1 Tax=Streptococcus sp. DD13 TaxID=1777881 RepID=UPI000798661D|nr:formimidoylglutamase [Streptococcus sp. DD13]KXT78054.1 Formiminoglutamase [Streptococcus sp. DD13]
MKLADYFPLTYPYYQGSIEDNPYTAKWGMRMQFLDLTDDRLTPFEGVAFGILGFKSDKGVYINNGRVGAVEGPTSIRSQIAKLPWHWADNVAVYDVGNIDGPNRSLDELQTSLAQAVQRMRSLHLFPVVLGGGHGTAYGHYLGLKQSLPKEQELAVINFDAHFDLRPYEETGPNSGTGFRQMSDHAKTSGQDFSYLALGIQEHCNNLFLFDYVAKHPSIQFLTGQDLYQMRYPAICEQLDDFLEDQTAFYLTIDMDCFAVGSSPGVSAIQSLGVDPKLALVLLQHLAASGKLIGFDLVEVSPPHDIDNHTANLAATLIFYISQVLAQR